MVSRPELGSGPSFRSGRESGRDTRRHFLYSLERPTLDLNVATLVVFFSGTSRR